MSSVRSVQRHMAAAAAEPRNGKCLVTVASAAVCALYDEVALFPKPGLVSFVDAGSHRDMDGRTFMRSLFALRHYFQHMAVLGAKGQPFPALEACGLAAERRMYEATRGVNTHRGAIFTMGLLCASAGALLNRGLPRSVLALRSVLLELWGNDLQERSGRRSVLPGGMAAREHGLRSASEEAALGFPVLFEVSIPTLLHALRTGTPKDAARLQTLMQTMSVLDDCNLAHRGGTEGLDHARGEARRFLAAGGMDHPDALRWLRCLHADFVDRRLSPGGSADMLAAACFVERLVRSQEHID